MRYDCERTEPAVTPPVRLHLSDGTTRVVNDDYDFFGPSRPPGRAENNGAVRGFMTGDQLTVAGVVVQEGGERAIRAAHVDGRGREEYLASLRGDPDSQAWAGSSAARRPAWASPCSRAAWG